MVDKEKLKGKVEQAVGLEETEAGGRVDEAEGRAREKVVEQIPSRGIIVEGASPDKARRWMR